MMRSGRDAATFIFDKRRKLEIAGGTADGIRQVYLHGLPFGLLHYPYYWLMLGTFILALLYGFIYLQSRKVFVMGLFHGWLGGLFFYTIVGRDPSAEVFDRLFH